MSIFKWPVLRKQYAGLDNPRFVSDIVVATEAVIDAVKAITGLNNTDFAIISGLEYVLVGAQWTYNPGIFYFNGVFYSSPAVAFNENLYLLPSIVSTEPQPFGDTLTRNIYDLYSSTATANPAGATPQFTGAMNDYRIGLKVIKANIISLLATQSSLGAAAFLNVGSTAGTVMAGDYAYSKAQVDAGFEPANGYIKPILHGSESVGNPPYPPAGNGVIKSISLGTTLPDAVYKVTGTIVTASGTGYYANAGVGWEVHNKTTTSFDVMFRDLVGEVQNINFEWILFK